MVVSENPMSNVQHSMDEVIMKTKTLSSKTAEPASNKIALGLATLMF